MDPKPPVKRCQSCGTLWNDELAGTEADGARSSDYCKLCYAEGKFLEPELSLDGMIQNCIKRMMRGTTVSEEQAEVVANATVPGLKRWNHVK
jgi:hypothetical protein